MAQSTFDSFLRTESIYPSISIHSFWSPKDIIFSKMAKTANKVIPLFFRKKYCILRPIFPATRQMQFAFQTSRSLHRRVEIKKQGSNVGIQINKKYSHSQ